jgi:hypothetical protein
MNPEGQGRTRSLDSWDAELCHAWHEFPEKSSKIVALGEPILSTQQITHALFFDAQMKKYNQSGITQGTTWRL